MEKPIRAYYKLLCPKPTLITDMPWDNLIVLDACRFDAFIKFNNIPGTLTKIVSAGTHTTEWLQANFADKDMKNTVYISANPYVSYYYLPKILREIPFYKIIEVWKDGWSDELQTVHPLMVNKATLKSIQSHPDKKHLIHYIQPHQPFIGNFRVQTERGVIQFKNEKQFFIDKRDAFQMLQDGLLDVNTIWRGYLSNLELALEYVNHLIPHLPGNVVVTSDHGNVFGRFRAFYGHPKNTPLPELLWVPWLEVASP